MITRLFGGFFVAFVLFAALTSLFDKSNKDGNLVGGWEYVEAYTEFPDGRRVNQFSSSPRGYFIILPNGHYSHIVIAGDLPKLADGTFRDNTPEENKAIAEGTLSHFGTYVQDSPTTFTVTIVKSSFPNFDGIKQTREITKLTNDTLQYINVLTTSGPGAKVVATLKRIW